MRRTKQEFIQELEYLGGNDFGDGPTISLDDLRQIAYSENMHHDFMTRHVFVLLQDGMWTAPTEPTPLFEDRFNVQIMKAKWDDDAKACGKYVADEHSREATIMRRMIDGRDKYGDMR